MPKNPPAKKHRHTKGCCAQDPVMEACETLAHYHLHHTEDLVTRITGELGDPDIYVVGDADWKLKLRQATAEFVNGAAHRGSNPSQYSPEMAAIVDGLNQTIAGMIAMRDLAATQGSSKQQFLNMIVPLLRTAVEMMEQQSAELAAPPAPEAVQ